MRLDTDTEKVEHWVADAWKRLADSPHTTLAQIRDPDYFIMQAVTRLHENPNGFEQTLLKLEIREVFEVVLERTLVHAEAILPHTHWTAWGGMDIHQAYQVMQWIEETDPGLAMRARLRLANICSRMHESLVELELLDFPAILPMRRGLT